MSKRSIVVSPSAIDAGEAQTAFDAELPELEELAPDELITPRVDMLVASAIAYAIAMRDVAASRRERLSAIGSVFDVAVIERMPMRSLAAFHARRKQSIALDAATSSRVSEASLRDAQACRCRMLRVLCYYFDDQPNYARRFEAIYSGTGYLDLANDLFALAELYEDPEIRTLIASDPKHYRREDPKLAQRLAAELLHGIGLGRDGDAAHWTDLARRAWTLLSNDYGTLRAAGKLVFRHDEDVDASYPPLVVPACETAKRWHIGGADMPPPLETAPHRS